MTPLPGQAGETTTDEVSIRRRRWRYELAVAVVVLAIAVRGVLERPLGTRAMYLSFWPAVMVSSWYGGLWPGLLSTVLSAIVIQLFWGHSLDPLGGGFRELIAQAAFVLLAAFISVLNEQRLRAIEKATRQERLALTRSCELQREIAERLALEADLIDANRALARSNEDLKGFAHMIGHDLQEPLRTIILYAELVRRRHGDALPSQGAEWLQIIESSAKRLTSMIRNLLDYAKAGKGAHADMPEFPLQQALQSALENLGELIHSSKAGIRFADLPVIRGDEIQLCQVFQNLIANAIKYRRDNVRPEISITASNAGGNWVLSVCDNGTGVDATQGEDIFKPFTRGTAKSDGSGIGLATCRRIIERHGGKIWLERTSAEGATFTFTLPAGATGRERSAHASG